MTTYELFTQANGHDVHVLTLEHLMSIKTGAEGSVFACRITEVENVDQVLHTKDLQVGKLVALKIITSKDTKVDYRYATRTPKILEMQLKSLNEYDEDHGFVRHYCEMLLVRQQIARNNTATTTNLALVMEFVPFTFDDVLINHQNLKITEFKNDLETIAYLSNAASEDLELSSFWTRHYPGGVVYSSHSTDPGTTKGTHERICGELDTEDLVTASTIMDQLVTCLYKYHLMNPTEEARHRDLRLPNLGIRANGSVVILDIGLSLLVKKDQREKGSTGLLSYNQGYNSPHIIEQYSKGTEETVYTCNDDWFQLIVSICRILTNEYPFKPNPKDEVGLGVPGDVYSHNAMLLEKTVKEYLDEFPDAKIAVQNLKESGKLTNILSDKFLQILNKGYLEDMPIPSYGVVLFLLSGQHFTDDEQMAESLGLLSFIWRSVATNASYTLVQRLSENTIKKTLYDDKGRLSSVGMSRKNKSGEYTLNDAFGEPALLLYTNGAALSNGDQYTAWDNCLYSPKFARFHYKNGKLYGYEEVREPAAIYYWVPPTNSITSLAEYYKLQNSARPQKTEVYEKSKKIVSYEYDRDGHLVSQEPAVKPQSEQVVSAQLKSVSKATGETKAPTKKVGNNTLFSVAWWPVVLVYGTIIVLALVVVYMFFGPKIGVWYGNYPIIPFVSTGADNIQTIAKPTEIKPNLVIGTGTQLYRAFKPDVQPLAGATDPGALITLRFSLSSPNNPVVAPGGKALDFNTDTAYILVKKSEVCTACFAQEYKSWDTEFVAIPADNSSVWETGQKTANLGFNWISQGTLELHPAGIVWLNATQTQMAVTDPKESSSMFTKVDGGWLTVNTTKGNVIKKCNCPNPD